MVLGGEVVQREQPFEVIRDLRRRVTPVPRHGHRLGPA